MENRALVKIRRKFLEGLVKQLELVQLNKVDINKPGRSRCWVFPYGTGYAIQPRYGSLPVFDILPCSSYEDIVDEFLALEAQTKRGDYDDELIEAQAKLSKYSKSNREKKDND